MKEIIEILCLRVWELRCCKVTRAQKVLQYIPEVFGMITAVVKKVVGPHYFLAIFGPIRRAF